MTVVVATDLDRTLTFSRAAIRLHGDGGRPLVAVEQYEGAAASWMTAAAADLFARLPGAGAVVVPATTRTPEQWRRMHLPGPASGFVIAANGGVLLVDGVPDESWSSAVADAVTRCAPLAEVHAHASAVCRAEWTVSVRRAHELFCYAVLERGAVPDGFVDRAAVWAHERGWRVSLQGRKLYWMPSTVTKSAALLEVRKRTGADSVLAAGDSLLDADLLCSADAGIVARHGELVATGWSAPHVRVTGSSGIRAGEEIIRWFAAELDERQSADRS